MPKVIYENSWPTFFVHNHVFVAWRSNFVLP
jgi:hypothetical protein